MLPTTAGKPDTTARHILQVLAEHAHPDGTNARPSVLRIRYRTGYDERTIQRALQRLHRAGLIALDGRVNGVNRWKLAMSISRPESDWATLETEHEQAKVADSKRRQADRKRHAAAALSGTQNPGQADDVRDAESRRPARKVPASGTQNPDVRDATPPEPPMNHQEPP